MEPDKTVAPTPTPAPANGEMPEKYIRTFSSDMDIFKKGGTTGLAPLKTPTPSPAERLVAPSSLDFVPIETKVPIPEPVVPPPAPIAPPMVTPIKTYSEDFRERMRNTQASTMTILAAEQDAEPRAHEALPEKSEQNNYNRWFVVAGIFLFCVSGIGVYIAYSKYLTALTPILVATTTSTPIFVDSRETVSGTGVVLMQAIKQSVDKPLALDTVRLLSFESTTSGSNIFLALNASVPGMLLRNVDAAGSMAGIVNTNSGQSPFFILSVSSYSTTFSGMLSWEPFMQSVLGMLFPLYPVPVPIIPTVATTTIATTTKTTTKIPAKTIATTTATTTVTAPSPVIGFRDEVVGNHDVRIYRDALGRSIILYGYWNQTTLVIARDPSAFALIIDRLATAHP